MTESKMLTKRKCLERFQVATSMLGLISGGPLSLSDNIPVTDFDFGPSGAKETSENDRSGITNFLTPWRRRTPSPSKDDASFDSQEQRADSTLRTIAAQKRATAQAALLGIPQSTGDIPPKRIAIPQENRGNALISPSVADVGQIVGVPQYSDGLGRFTRLTRALRNCPEAADSYFRHDNGVSPLLHLALAIPDVKADEIGDYVKFLRTIMTTGTNIFNRGKIVKRRLGALDSTSQSIFDRISSGRLLLLQDALGSSYDLFKGTPLLRQIRGRKLPEEELYALLERLNHQSDIAFVGKNAESQALFFNRCLDAHILANQQKIRRNPLKYGKFIFTNPTAGKLQFLKKNRSFVTNFEKQLNGNSMYSSHLGSPLHLLAESDLRDDVASPRLLQEYLDLIVRRAGGKLLNPRPQHLTVSRLGNTNLEGLTALQVSMRSPNRSNLRRVFEDTLKSFQTEVEPKGPSRLARMFRRSPAVLLDRHLVKCHWARNQAEWIQGLRNVDQYISRNPKAFKSTKWSSKTLESLFSLPPSKAKNAMILNSPYLLSFRVGTEGENLLQISLHAMARTYERAAKSPELIAASEQAFKDFVDIYLKPRTATTFCPEKLLEGTPEHAAAQAQLLQKTLTGRTIFESAKSTKNLPQLPKAFALLEDKASSVLGKNAFNKLMNHAISTRRY